MSDMFLAVSAVTRMRVVQKTAMIALQRRRSLSVSFSASLDEVPLRVFLLEPNKIIGTDFRHCVAAAFVAFQLCKRQRVATWPTIE